MFTTIFKPVKRKVAIHAVVSLCFVLILLAVPTFGVQGRLLQLNLSWKLLSVALSWVFGFIYYPFTCGVLSLADAKVRKSIGAGGIAVAIFSIIVFNPLTFSVIAVFALPHQRSDDVANKPCGFEIMNFLPSSGGPAAGLRIGDIVYRVNDAEIRSIVDVKSAIEGKRPADSVSVITNRGTFAVRLAESPQDASIPFLAVTIRPATCR